MGKSRERVYYKKVRNPLPKLVWESIKKEIKETNWILDVGSGSGTLMLQACSEGFQIMGVEFSLTGCNLTKIRFKENNLERCLIVAGDIMKLPFRNTSFDVVCCIYVLGHFLNDDLAIEEIYCVLREKGKLILAVHNENRLFSYYGLINYLKGKKIGYNPIDEEHNRFFTYEEVKKNSPK